MPGALRSLARSWCNNRQSIPGDNGRCFDPIIKFQPVLNSEGKLVTASRVLSHPQLTQVEGEGFYTYPFNPHLTKNFIYAPTPKVDSSAVRTVGTNILVTKPQLDEDTIITEIWTGGSGELSTLTEMARVFHAYWREPLARGQTLGWQPLDHGEGRYNVRIVSVQIGGLDYEYREVREHQEQADPSYLDTQLVLQLKLENPVLPPTGEVTLEGI